MGGKTFQSEGITTPRMPADVYYQVLNQVRTKLQPFYLQVESPIEAPEKIDHGDLDIFAVPATETPPSTAKLIAILNAVAFKENRPTIHLAIPWPENLSSSVSSTEFEKAETHDAKRSMKTFSRTATGKSESEQNAAQDLRYVQVDLHVCKYISELKYTLFMHSHGDLLNIIGGIIRRFGLTCSNSGFYIRIAELESYNKNLARYKIFDRPEEILGYLGMDEERFWQPFKSLEECMDYAATCRFHDPAKGKRYDDVKTEIMNAADRRRLPKRSMFKYWVETYLPSHRDDPARPASHMSRIDVIEEAKLLLGKEFAESFDRQRADGIREMDEQKLWADIRKETKAEGSQLTYAMKGLRREIMVVPDDSSLMSEVQKDFVTGRFDDVKNWGVANWKEVGTRQQQLDREKSTQKYLVKLEKEGKLRPQDEIEAEKSVLDKTEADVDD